MIEKRFLKKWNKNKAIAEQGRILREVSEDWRTGHSGFALYACQDGRAV